MITVLGVSGFIGQRLRARLRELDLDHYAPARDERLSRRKLGDVIYAIGLTADFRTRPFDTVEAHVCKLQDVLREADFDSLLYLSSTRLYGGREDPASEEDPLQIAPLDPGDLYNISKAMGESIALNCGRHTRVARVSNVYGDDFISENFLSTLIKGVVGGNAVTLQTSAASTKDYVSINDVVNGLIDIATRGTQRLYNLACGINTSNEQLVEALGDLTGCHAEFTPGAPDIIFPRIIIDRMKEEFDYAPSRLLDDIAHIVDLFRNKARIV